MKILYIGPDYRGSNGTSWRDAFLDLEHEVETIDDERFDPAAPTLTGRWLRKRRGRPSDEKIAELSSRIEEAVGTFHPHLIFFIKAYHVTPDTLDRVRRQAPCFAWMNDDMFNPANQSPTFAENIKLFDTILTTKSYNVREFHAAGCPRAVYIPNSFDPRIHYPVSLTPDDRARFGGDIAFIGVFRDRRAEELLPIAKEGEFRLNVWGVGWQKMRRIDYIHKRRAWRALWPSVRPHPLWCEDMSRAIQASSVTLGLLNRENRDLQTCRSFEIPACAGLMLAQRTEEHRMFFEEDKEAVYFSSFDEMIEKARFYVAHEAARLRIAQAGYRRCCASPYSIIDRARHALQLAGNFSDAPAIVG